MAKVKGYAEAQVENAEDAKFMLQQVPGHVKKAVLLVWFDAQERPQSSDLRLFEYWEIR